jgi:hypothetical protein
MVTTNLAGVALVASLSAAAAGSIKPESATAIDTLPASEIVTTMLSVGLSPTTKPLRREYYYVMHAYDPLGVEMLVVADAQLGDILSVTPVLVGYAAYYVRAPRIIHVPEHDESLEHSGKKSNAPGTAVPASPAGDAPSVPPGGG